MREVLEHMSIAQLIDTILINPTVHVAPSYRDTGLSATYTFQPLSNLVYTRDQQARSMAILSVWKAGLFDIRLSHSESTRQHSMQDVADNSASASGTELQ